MATYRFQRGETIILALDAVEGDVGAVSGVTANLKGRGGVAIPFSVSERAAEGDNLAGWTLVIDAAASSDLQLGLYEVAARIAVGAGVVITEPVSVNIVASPAV